MSFCAWNGFVRIKDTVVVTVSLRRGVCIAAFWTCYRTDEFLDKCGLVAPLIVERLKWWRRSYDMIQNGDPINVKSLSLDWIQPDKLCMSRGLLRFFHRRWFWWTLRKVTKHGRPTVAEQSSLVHSVNQLLIAYIWQIISLMWQWVFEYEWMTINSIQWSLPSFCLVSHTTNIGLVHGSQAQIIRDRRR